ncbi:unnamed protein product [Cyclocybe aegerita]|uniref:Acyl carrier protein n=1 Tax=Cyclocybe aegerita TaxID=1973307 RepID=A0A8S0VY24_CYCAE|nr:unnamed protein product [Cyclocybe aegerita]
MFSLFSTNNSLNHLLITRHVSTFSLRVAFGFVKLALPIMSLLSRLLPRAAGLSRVARSTHTAHRIWVPRAMYSSGGGLTRQVITSRILETLKGYEKIDPAKLTPTASFSQDLGLDSLDAVEVVMAVEEEFSIEIPDAEADEIQTVAQAIDYIAKTPEGPIVFLIHRTLFPANQLSLPICSSLMDWS